MNRSFGMGVMAALFFVAGCTLFQSSKSPLKEETVIGKIDDQPITWNEVLNRYQQSNALFLDTRDQEELEDFIQLYMNYRLKLAVAKDAGYMDDPEILAELDEYERESAYSFWIQRQVEQQMLDELYERSKEHIHAQHILITMPEDASPSDTTRAFAQLMEAREKFLNGEKDFMSLSDEYSTRQRGQSMGGDLGYFSAGWAVKPFEDAVYLLEEGEVSKPFRTEFGYHLVHVKDRIETGPEKHFSHIYLNTRNVPHSLDSVFAKAEIAFHELKSGTPWKEVVETYSQDEQSRLAKGQIGWIGYGMYDPLFTNKLMQIENVGDFTRPFESVYGIHIARLDSVYQPDKQEVYEELAEQLRQLPRFRNNEEAVLEHAADKGTARFHRKNLIAFEEFLRNHLHGNFSDMAFPDSLLQKPVFSFNNKHWTAGDYVAWLKPVVEEQPDQHYHHRLSRDFRRYILDSELTALTRKQFPDFSRLSNDYLSGLAVFRVNEDSIWTYSRQDTARLKELFEINADQYHFDTRYRFVRFSAKADSTLEQVKTRIHSGESVDNIPNEFSDVIMRRDMSNTFGIPPYSHLADLNEGEFSPLFEYRQRPTTLYLEEIMEARPMTFEEAYNRLVTDYQTIRETEWLQAMRKKYRMEIYPEVLQIMLTEKYD